LGWENTWKIRNRFGKNTWPLWCGDFAKGLAIHLTDPGNRNAQSNKIKITSDAILYFNFRKQTFSKNMSMNSLTQAGLTTYLTAHFAQDKGHGRSPWPMVGCRFQSPSRSRGQVFSTRGPNPGSGVGRNPMELALPRCTPATSQQQVRGIK